MARLSPLNQSLDKLESHAWPPVLDDAPSFLKRCHALRSVPIGQLAPGELRVLIGQGVGTQYLVPLAIALLSKNPLIEGDYYPGDLLSAAMSAVPGAQPRERKAWVPALRRAALQAESELSKSEEEKRQNRQLLKDVHAFLKATAA